MLAVSTFLLGACQPTIRNHGYLIDQASMNRVVPGQTSREEVYQLLGSPSSLATFDDRRWYYISQRTEQMSFYSRDIIGQDVYTVEFDERGLVSDVAQLDLDDAQEVDPSSDKTRTLGKELNLLEQLLTNVGRFNNGNRSGGSTVPGG